MNIEELIKLKEELNIKYSEEKKEYDLTEIKEEKEILEEELKDILKEITKVDSLIDIYRYPDKRYIVMKLERLYMMLIADLNENQFDELSEDKMFEIFDNFFPDNWEYKYNLEEKEKLLLDAICGNELINTKVIKKKFDDWYVGD